jgi:hypothetical protein
MIQLPAGGFGAAEEASLCMSSILEPQQPTPSTFSVRFTHRLIVTPESLSIITLPKVNGMGLMTLKAPLAKPLQPKLDEICKLFP